MKRDHRGKWNGLFALTLALAAALASGCSTLSKVDLGSPGRGSWQRPEKVVDALGIESGARVADIGAGQGYFVGVLAEAVGSEGRVYAVEVDAESTTQMTETFASDSNVEVVLGEFADPLLPDRAIDLVLVVNTYHHIDDRPDYFERLKHDLTASGRVAVIEPNAEITGWLRLLLDEGHMSHAEAVVEEMRAAGYREVERHDFLLTQIFLIFEPEDGMAPTAGANQNEALISADVPAGT